MDIKKKVGRKLRDLRENANLTQEKLAEEIGVQTNTISKVETGRHFISADLLENLSNYFKTDETYFFNFNYTNYSKNDTEKIETIIKKLKMLKPAELEFIYKTVNAISE